MFFSLLRVKTPGYLYIEYPDKVNVGLLNYKDLNKNSIDYFDNTLDFLVQDNYSSYQNQAVSIVYSKSKRDLYNFIKRTKIYNRNPDNHLITEETEITKKKYSFTLGQCDKENIKYIEDVLDVEVLDFKFEEQKVECNIIDGNYHIFLNGTIYENILVSNITSLFRVLEENINVSSTNRDDINFFFSLQIALASFMVSYYTGEDCIYSNFDFTYQSCLNLNINYNIGYDSKNLIYLDIKSTIKCGIVYPFIDEIVKMIKLTCKSFYNVEHISLDIEFIFNETSPIFVFPTSVAYCYSLELEKAINKIAFLLGIDPLNYKKDLLQNSLVSGKTSVLLNRMINSISEISDFKRKNFAFNLIKTSKPILISKALKGIGFSVGILINNLSIDYIKNDSIDISITVDKNKDLIISLPFQTQVNLEKIKVKINALTNIPTNKIFFRHLYYRKLNSFIKTIQKLSDALSQDILVLMDEKSEFEETFQFSKKYYLDSDMDIEDNKDKNKWFLENSQYVEHSYCCFICEVEYDNYLKSISLKKVNCIMYCGRVKNKEYLKAMIISKIEKAYYEIFTNSIFDNSILTTINKPVVPIENINIEFISTSDSEMLSISGIEYIFSASLLSAIYLASYKDINSLPII